MFTTSELRRALLRKGFVDRQGSKHYKLALELDGILQAVWTVVSRATQDIGPSLESSIARELRMPGAQYLRRFVDCAVSLDDYLAHLRENGVL